jgi:hypothetical protein
MARIVGANQGGQGGKTYDGLARSARVDAEWRIVSERCLGSAEETQPGCPSRVLANRIALVTSSPRLLCRRCRLGDAGASLGDRDRGRRRGCPAQ